MKVVNIQSKRLDKENSRSVEAAISDYSQFFETIFDQPHIDPEAFSNLYHYQVRYSNPDHDFHGIDRLRSVLEDIALRCEAPKLIVRDRAISGRHGFLYWKFSRDKNNKKSPWLTGMTRLKFDGYGRVISHRDVWDTGQAPRRPLPKFRDWWRNHFSKQPRRSKKPAAAPKKFHGLPPF